MTILALIPAPGSADLTELCVASLRAFAPEVQPVVIVTQLEARMPWTFADPARPQMVYLDIPMGPLAHGQALDTVRHYRAVMGDIGPEDLVILLDNDTCIVSPEWIEWVQKVLEHPGVGAVGAKAHGILHASMMAMRASTFRAVRTWTSPRPEERTEARWLDTGGLACYEILDMGMELVGSAGASMPEGWASYRDLWWHLGSGTATDPERMHVLRRWRHRKALARRRQFLRAGWDKVNTAPPGLHPITAREFNEQYDG